MTAITRQLLNTTDMGEFTVDELYMATIDDWAAVSFAAAVGLLPNSRVCERCARPMHLVSRQENIDKKRWICKISEGKKKKYCSTKSIRSGTFFEKSHLSIRKIVHVIYWWAMDLPPSLIEPLCSISTKAATDFVFFLRQECEKWYMLDSSALSSDTRNEADGESGDANGVPSRWTELRKHQSALETSTKALLEKRFRSEANGAVFARIIDAIRRSHPH